MASAENQNEQWITMFQADQKVVPRSVWGRFAKLRWVMVWFTQMIFYGTAWLSYNDRQFLLFDLQARRFYIGPLVLYPQDFIYLTALLIVCALSLFLFTAVAGRLWCGYTCPQTVYSEIFMWVERKIEGDRNARLKLAAHGWNADRLGKALLKHGVWMAIALWTGFTFVGYFTPIKTLFAEFEAWQVSGWQTFWVAFYAFATYGNAGYMREQVCKYMCPYARFQSAMFDKDTLLVTYDQARGEPRGSRSKHADLKASGLGSCIDCNLCVHVCPTGIDIRNGLQYECIGCAACVDVCNSVMDKVGYPRGLVRYSTQNGIQNHWDTRQMLRRMMRPRVLIYTAVTWALIGVVALSLWMRDSVKVDVVRDRSVQYRLVEDGFIENVYRVLLMNTTELPVEVHARVLSQVSNGEKGTVYALTGEQHWRVAPTESKWVVVHVKADPEGLHKGANTFEFEFEAQQRGQRISMLREKAVLLAP